jgi:hypothetical protein
MLLPAGFFLTPSHAEKSFTAAIAVRGNSME